MTTMDTGGAPGPVPAPLSERPLTALSPDRLLRIAPLADTRGLRIEGELDRSTLPILTRALALMTGSFTLDLGSLTFIDVGGLRALVTTAAALHDGHRLTLRSAPAQVRRLLDHTDWYETPGLHLQTGDHLG
jgi:ABC-type transporter Mla MlaB component